MALRDTLRAVAEISEADAAFEATRPQRIAEWQRSVKALNSEIRKWLAEYEADRTVSFETETVDIREEMLGTYSVQAMDIRAGQFVVRVQPAGRIIVGAVGRVDMYRQGRSSADERVLFLRSLKDGSESWALRRPKRLGGSHSNIKPLDKASFEAALDEILT